MEKLEKISNELYLALYGGTYDLDYQKAAEIWLDIRQNERRLKAATALKQNRHGKFYFNSNVIVDQTLRDSENVNVEILKNIKRKIYSFKSLQNTIVGGSSGFSFLLLTLMLKNVKLSKQQKNIAIRAATTYTDKTIHGHYPFDIRYWILKNPQFDIDQKREVIFKGFLGAKEWENFIDSLLMDILVSYNSEGIEIYIEDVLQQSKKRIYKMLPDQWGQEIVKDTAFVKTLAKIRPTQN